jgi:hypothetical protein
MSRRAFLSSGAAAGIATVALGGAGTARAEDAPANDVDAIVLQVAAAAAAFPYRFDTVEGAPVGARLTARRVARAWSRVSSPRAEQARRGAQLLLERELGGAGTDELLEALSVLAAEARPGQLDDLKALVAIAGATLADDSDPSSDIVPGIWLGALENMHVNGDTPAMGAAS